MKLFLVLFLLLGLSGLAQACDGKQPQQSIADVVFNNSTPQSAEFDQQLQSMYGCKYTFAMLFSSSSYEPMHMVSGSMPSTPTDSDGKPIKGVVLVGFVLNTDGIPSDPVIVKSQDERLAKIALSHVLGLRFQPAKFQNKVVRALGAQMYNFE